jgi:hypothetical protein
MKKMLLAAVLFAMPAMPVITHAQDAQDVAALARAAGCGPNEAEFNVKTNKNQHPTAPPEAGTALVYVFDTVNWTLAS